MENSRLLPVQDGEPESGGPPRIHVRRLAVALIFSLLLPVGIAFLAELALGTWPGLTIGGSLVCIPVAAIIVGGMALQEMNRAVRLVAPEAPGEEAPAAGHSSELAVASPNNVEAG
jgi:hypothetical protein